MLASTIKQANARLEARNTFRKNKHRLITKKKNEPVISEKIFCILNTHRGDRIKLSENSFRCESKDNSNYFFIIPVPTAIFRCFFFFLIFT